MRILMLSIFCVTSVACDMGFERQSQIARVRVLAVRSVPTELTVPQAALAAPQLSVQLEAFVVKPDGTTPPVRFALCRFGNPYAADFECPGKDGLDLPDGKLDLTSLEVQSFTGLPVTAGPPGTPPGTLLPAKLSFYVGFEANDGTGTPEGLERGVYQLYFRRTDAPNQHPTLLDITYENKTLAEPLPLSTKVVLKPLLSSDSRETYAGPEGEALEPIAYSWHATGTGTVNFFRSLEPAPGQEDNAATEYTTAEAAENVTFYVVARDGRGGVSWLSRTVKVE